MLPDQLEVVHEIMQLRAILDLCYAKLGTVSARFRSGCHSIQRLPHDPQTCFKDAIIDSAQRACHETKSSFGIPELSKCATSYCFCLPD